MTDAGRLVFGVNVEVGGGRNETISPRAASTTATGITWSPRSERLGW